MAGSSKSFVRITRTPRTIGAWKMATEQLKERAESLHRSIPYALAKELHEAILGSLPSGSDFREMSEKLQVSEVTAGVRGRSGAFAVHAPTRGKRIKKIDVPRTIIHVRAKRRPRSTAKDIEFLVNNGPWTADTIPFWPSKADAIVIQRKVSKREADRVAKMQQKSEHKTKRELLLAGRKVAAKKEGEPGVVTRKSKAVPDLAMLALRLEFGEEGQSSKPIWRKTIIMLRSEGVKKLPRKYPAIRDVFSDPNSKKYKTWPPQVKKIQQSEAAKFRGFQKRLGFG